MDVVEFRRNRQKLGGRGPFAVINLIVNGTRLQDLVRTVELPYAKAEGDPSLAGSYAGLAVGPNSPASHFLGEPVETWFGDGDTVLLGCQCGDPGCWPLTARVTVSDTTVVWSGFRTGHRDWDLSAVGRFHIRSTRLRELADQGVPHFRPSSSLSQAHGRRSGR